MKKIPFNLESWLADKSQKVVTSDGHSARIICTDAKSTGENPDRILALISADSGFENALFYTRDGWCLSDSSQHRKKDLFLVTPDPELTEFERAVFDCIDETVVSYIDDYTPDTRVDLIQAQFEKWSPKLLAIASKQIEAERIAVVGNTIDEDERIRKELIQFLRDYPTNLPNGKYSRSDFFDWLEKQKEQKLLPGFDDLTPDEKMNHPLYLEGFDVGREVGRVEAEQKPAEVDLEKEIDKKVLELHTAPCYDELASFARHFYELGLNSSK